MKTIKFGDYTFYLGQRVAAKIGTSGNWYYGIVIKFVNQETLGVRFDIGAPEYKVRKVMLSDVVPVINWKMDKKPHPFSELVTTTLPPHKTVSSKQMGLDVHLFDGLWMYTNVALFNGKLRKPAFKFNANLNVLGMCHNSGVKEGGTTLIEISKRNMASLNFYETLVHEMVHQYNFEINKRNDNHGPLFLMWKDDVKSKVGLKLEPTADLIQLDMKVDLSSERKSKKPHYYAIVDYLIDDGESPMYAAIAFRDKDSAMDFYIEWQNYTKRQNLVTGIYARMVRAPEGMQSVFQAFYGHVPKTKYNRQMTTIYFYETYNSNAGSILTKVSKQQEAIYDIYDQSMFGVAKVSSFSFLSKEQVHQLGGTVVAEIDYAGLEKEWEI